MSSEQLTQKQRAQRQSKQSLVIRKLNDRTVSGGPTFRCKVYPPRDATGAGAPERDGGQLGADSISVAGACAGTPGYKDSPNTERSTKPAKLSLTRARVE